MIQAVASMLHNIHTSKMIIVIHFTVHYNKVYIVHGDQNPKLPGFLKFQNMHK